MSFDEKLFHLFVKKINFFQKRMDSSRDYIACNLEEEKKRLELLSSILNKRKIEIIQTDVETQSLKNCLFLQKKVKLFPSYYENYNCYLYWILSHYQSVQKEIFLEEFEKQSNQKKREQAKSVIDQSIIENFPGYTQFILEKSKNILPLIPINRDINIVGKSKRFSNEDDRTLNNKTIIEIKTSGLPKLIENKKEEENPIVHNFEKVKTLDNFSNENKNLNGDDDSLEESDAYSQLELSKIIQSEKHTATMIKSDVVIENGIIIEQTKDETTSFFEYSEWFFNEKKYRDKWCRVITKDANVLNKTFEFQINKTIVEKYRKNFIELFNLEREKKRQLDGDEIDLDELIRYKSEEKKYHVENPRIFSQRTFFNKEISLLILIDSSLSTDSFVGNQRILPFFQSITSLLVGVLESVENHVGIYSFYSQTRNQCYLEKIKSLKDSYKVAKENLSYLKPQHYTRMGPAIRHMGSLFDKEKSRKKLLIILSDGKPTDFDRYEGRHGFEDTKKALDELSMRKISSHLFSFSSKKEKYISTIFTKKNFSIITQEEEFLDKMMSLLYFLIKK